MKCEEMDNLTVDYLEGHLPPKHKEAFERHLERCPKCRNALEYYMQVVKGLQNIPKKKCPEPVIENVLSSVIGTKRKPFVLAETFRSISPRQIWRMPYFATAALIIIFAFIFFFNQKEKAHIRTPYTMAEVRQADKQMRLALNYIAYCYDSTQDAIENNVIPNYVVEPIKSSMTSALNEIINGG